MHNGSSTPDTDSTHSCTAALRGYALFASALLAAMPAEVLHPWVPGIHKHLQACDKPLQHLLKASAALLQASYLPACHAL